MIVKTHAGTISAKKEVLIRIVNAFYSESIYYKNKGLMHNSDESAMIGGEIAQALRDVGYL